MFGVGDFQNEDREIFALSLLLLSRDWKVWSLNSWHMKWACLSLILSKFVSFKFCFNYLFPPQIPQKESLASVPAPRADQTKMFGCFTSFPLLFSCQRLTLHHSAPPWPGSIVSAEFFQAVCLSASRQGIQRITSQHVYNHSGCWPVMAKIWLA